METRLKEGINWVGYVDWNVRDFHGYETHRGATYNAYLIQDQKTALIDTVKKEYSGVLLKNISAFIDPSKIDYIICNHAEPDHSGALPDIVIAIPDAEVVCNKKCRETLSMLYDTTNWNFKIIQSLDQLSLGSRTLKFVDTPMVHWPESMFTFIPEEKLLFSMDAFGQHYATSNRFDDTADFQLAMLEAKIYYANIVMLYGTRVVKALGGDDVLDFDFIAPSHGIIWRSHVADILKAYMDWVVCKPSPKVLVIYDTMWNSTRMMAEAICEGAMIPGVEVKLMYLGSTSLTDIATESLDCATIAFGSPTLNLGMMPKVAAALTYLKGLKPAGKKAFAFGSFGWSRGGPEGVHEFLEAMKWEILREPLKSMYRPTPEILDECRSAGLMLAETALEMTGNEQSVKAHG